MKFDIRNKSLASEGKELIEWAAREMSVLKLIRERFRKEKPLKNVTLGACLHITSETANLAITLRDGGAKIILCASNPLSTNDAIASSLVRDYGIPVYAINGENNSTYYKHLNAVLDYNPVLTMDDGADLVGLLHNSRKELLKNVVGSSEETTTGIIRLRAMEKNNVLKIPVIAVNDNLTKHLFDNRYGTGQSTIDGIIRATNILLAGKVFIVVGFGWCGKGVAMRARGMGARVIVCEVDPIKALEAKMEGYEISQLKSAVRNADILVTVTGNKHVVDLQHFKEAKDGLILANAGHFDVEINKKALEKVAKTIKKVRPMVDEYDLGSKKIYLLAEGRLVNLSAADGHPAAVMDMSFAGQALAAEFLWKQKGKLENKVYSLPKELDEEIASLKLRSEHGIIDVISQQQKKYLESWNEGT